MAPPQRFIFVDLDNTLIATRPCSTTPPPPHWKTLTLDDAHSESMETKLHPESTLFLATLRSMGKIFMLTSAVRSYALAHNDIFSLGFPAERIFAREDWLFDIPTAYGGRHRELLNPGQFPGSVLIDDMPTSSDMIKSKLAWLGKGSSHVSAPYFASTDHPSPLPLLPLVEGFRIHES